MHVDGTPIDVTSWEVTLAKDAAGQPKTKIQSTGRVIRAICILNQPIPGVVNSNNQPAESCQIIIPQRELKRNCDVYITMLSNANGVTPQNKLKKNLANKIFGYLARCPKS